MKLVLGVRRDARECEPPGYAGCIVARRKLRYVEHERLRLPITLYAQCENVPCDAESTCNFLGQCVSANVDQGSCETDEGCTVAGDRPTSIPKPVEDASVPQVDGEPPLKDSGTDVAPDVASDAPAPDAPSDAPTDSKPEASVNQDSGTPGYIYCPPTYCSAQSQKCCTNGGFATCVQMNLACTQPSVAIHCDGREDCPVGQTCCVENDGVAKCKLTMCVGIGYAELCHSNLDCSGARQCSMSNLYAAIYPTCQ